MIVVLGSRHDPVASDLVRRWPQAELCSAEDLTLPGWVWPLAPGSGAARWVVAGSVVADERVTGVFLRRSTVHPPELTTTHADDRVYLAAELHAFLVHILATTRAVVVNPVDAGGAFGEAALRPESWMKLAAEAGIGVAPLRIRSASRAHPPEALRTLEVVGGDLVGSAPPSLADAASRVCVRLDLCWAVVSFDRSDRLAAVSTTPCPSAQAAELLGRVLAHRATS